MYNNQVYTIISIADIHMGVIDPFYMYTQLKKQFIEPLIDINFDILAICGDLFDSKFMSNNLAVSYALQLVNDIVELCACNGATLIILDGTQSHDNGQLSLFYHYMYNTSYDVRIIEEICFQKIKGLNVLCIPERYGIDEDVYKEFLFNSGGYDLTLLHGTYKGSFKGSEVATLKSNHAPVFGDNSFINCGGPILMGHYHVAGCYGEYAYYNGSPLRFRFGEEQPKGFLITLLNPNNRMHYTELVPIESHSYITINIDDIINRNPDEIINYIKNVKSSENIDYIRVQYNEYSENMEIVRNYFRNSGNVKLQELNKKDRHLQEVNKSILEQNNQYSYILDPNLSDYDKFTQYVNQNEGYEFISTDELIKILEEL